MALPSGLYVVATPIGNLEDITLRALRVLREASLVVAEDTRHTRKLLTHHRIHGRVAACNARSSPARRREYVERMAGGEALALVTDAGTPGISDPGGLLVADAAAAGIAVFPVPGPSSVTAAMSVAGMAAERFVFEGFPPRRRGERRRRFLSLAADSRPLLFLEAPPRLLETLELLQETLGNRAAVVTREMTKQFEEVRRGRLQELIDHFRSAAPRGEFVLVVEGASGPTEPAGIRERLEARAVELLRGGVSARDAARQLAEELGISRREAYAATVRRGR